MCFLLIVSVTWSKRNAQTHEHRTRERDAIRSQPHTKSIQNERYDIKWNERRVEHLQKKFQQKQQQQMKENILVWHKITETHNIQTDKRKIVMQTTNRLWNIKHKMITAKKWKKRKRKKERKTERKKKAYTYTHSYLAPMRIGWLKSDGPTPHIIETFSKSYTLSPGIASTKFELINLINILRGLQAKVKMLLFWMMEMWLFWTMTPCADIMGHSSTPHKAAKKEKRKDSTGSEWASKRKQKVSRYMKEFPFNKT